MREVPQSTSILLTEWYNLQLDRDQSILSNITKMQLLAQKLANLGETKSEAEQVTKVICSLPPSYQHIVAAWDNLAAMDQTLANLKARLLKHESLLARNGNPLEHFDKAFYSQQIKSTRKPVTSSIPTPSHPNHSKPQSSKVCNYCKKLGHIISECRKLKAKNHTSSQQSQPTTSKAYGSSTFVVSATNPKDQWIADAGASEHMTGNKSWFIKLTPVPYGSWSVKLADDSIASI